MKVLTFLGRVVRGPRVVTNTMPKKKKIIPVLMQTNIKTYADYV